MEPHRREEPAGRRRADLVEDLVSPVARAQQADVGNVAREQAPDPLAVVREGMRHHHRIGARAERQPVEAVVGPAVDELRVGKAFRGQVGGAVIDDRHAKADPCDARADRGIASSPAPQMTSRGGRDVHLGEHAGRLEVVALRLAGGEQRLRAPGHLAIEAAGFRGSGRWAVRRHEHPTQDRGGTADDGRDGERRVAREQRAQAPRRVQARSPTWPAARRRRPPRCSRGRAPHTVLSSSPVS